MWVMLELIVLGFSIGAAGAFIVARYASRLGLLDNPNQRSSHSTPTPRGGGVGLVLVFVASAWWAELSLFFWLPLLLLALISFYDDFSPLSSRSRLIAQLLLALVMVAGPGGWDSWSVLLVPFWILFLVGTTNFYNFIDGINGIAALSGLAAFGLLAVFSWQLTGQADSVAVALAAACLGFLPFNFPQARVFMGDVGSVLLGCAFALLVFRYTDSFANFICLLSFLFLVYADTLTTLLVRMWAGERLTQAHRRHLYQLLCNEGGLAHWLVALSYFLIQVAIGILMLGAWANGLLWQILLLVLCTGIFVGVGFKIRQRFA